MIRDFLAAVSFLSILPVGKFQVDEAGLRRALGFFPLAGLLFAAVGFGVAYATVWILPTLPAAMFLAIFPEILTKGFHLDGLADSADGMLSSRPRERKLEIMRDSHIGTMGVAAIFALLGIKFALFASLPLETMPFAAAAMLLGGRCGIIFYIAACRSARPDGLGKLWCGRRPLLGILTALLLPILTILPFGLQALWLLPVLIAGALIWSRITDRVLGGATGDTIGCFEELSELLSLASVLVFYRLNSQGY